MASDLAHPRAAVDQADDLRRLARKVLPHARVFVVTSGKGGVGKSNLSVAIALALSPGRRVVLLDADLGLANVDVLLGVKAERNLADVLAGRCDMVDALAPGPCGLSVLAGASGVPRMADLGETERQTLFHHLDGLQHWADILVIDTGAGISRNVIGFAACADDVVVVTTPEPTAMIDAYAAIKMIHREDQHGRVRVVVNQAASEREGEKVARGVAQTCRRFLGIQVEHLGTVPADAHVPEAVRRQKSFFIMSPGCAAAAAVRGIAAGLVPDAKLDPQPSQFLHKLKRLFGR